MGGPRHDPEGAVAEAGGAGLRRALRLRRVRRVRAFAARGDARLRGAVALLRLGRGVPVDPQHVRGDARPLWLRRSEGAIPRPRDLDGDRLFLLPDRPRGAGVPRPLGPRGLEAAILGPAVSVETGLSYCLTEPGSGSDAAGLRT